MGSEPLRRMLYPQAAYGLLMLADTCYIYHIFDACCSCESMIKVRGRDAVMIVIGTQL